MQIAQPLPGAASAVPAQVSPSFTAIATVAPVRTALLPPAAWPWETGRDSLLQAWESHQAAAACPRSLKCGQSPRLEPWLLSALGKRVCDLLGL